MGVSNEMINKGKVSIIIPVYNVEDYVYDCLKSVICQTYKNIEVIIVDDGSTDLSSEICREFENKFQSVRYIYQKNQGLSAARNTGLQACTGEYVYCLDSDDFIFANTIEILVDKMENYVDIVSAGFHIIEEEERFSYQIYKKPKFYMTTPKDFYLQVISNHACGKLYRRTLFRDVRYPINQNYEDVATTHKLFYKAAKIQYTNEGLYCYRIRRGAITQTPTEKNINDYILSYKSVKEFYSGYYNEEIEYYLMTILYGIYSRLCRSRLHNKKDYSIYIRNEFKTLQNVHLTSFLSMPMTYKLISYKYGFSYIMIIFIDAVRNLKVNILKY